MDLAELQKQIGVDLAAQAEDLEPVEGTYEFKFFTREQDGRGGALKAAIEKNEETGEEEYVLSGVASSTIKDLHGDTMLPSALIDMESQAKNNLTIFLNHEYKVPEDVAGSVRDAAIEATGEVDKETGAPLYDLRFKKISVNKRNARAVESFMAMKDGTKLGLSIGARIPEGGAIRNKKTGHLLISHVKLLETSIVGIPANPRSWIDSIAKSVKAGPVEKAASPEVHIDTVVVETPAVEVKSADVVEAADAVLDEVKADLTKSDDPSQVAPPSEPGADGDAPADVTAAADDPVVTIDVSKATAPELVDALIRSQSTIATMSVELLEARQSLLEVTQRAATAEQERDRAVRVAAEVMRDATDLMDRVSRLPVGQKATFRVIKSEFGDLKDLYGEEILRQLQKGNNE